MDRVKLPLDGSIPWTDRVKLPLDGSILWIG